MARKRFSVEQIVAVLKQAEMGLPVAEQVLQSSTVAPSAQIARLSRSWGKGEVCAGLSASIDLTSPEADITPIGPVCPSCAQNRALEIG